MDNAYMIRSDGKAFPVVVHTYGSPDDTEETLAAAEWLYNHTRFSAVRQLITKFVAAYAVYLDPSILEDCLPDEIQTTLQYAASHIWRGYHVLTPEFVQGLRFDKTSLEDLPSLENLNVMVNAALNEEFLRARYNGKYDSDDNNQEMYFRVSSTGVNWFPIIWQFVYDHQRQISAVTITKDEESTGQKGYYYNLDGQPVNHMSVNDFITVSGNPVIDKKKSIPITERLTSMNTMRLRDKLRRAQIKDAQTNYIQQE